VATLAARTCVSPVFGDLDEYLGQVDNLVPKRLGIVWASLGCKGATAAFTDRGQEIANLCDHAGREPHMVLRRVSWLGAGFTARRFLGGRLRCARRIGGGRRRRIAGIAAEELAQLGLQLCDALLERSNAPIAFSTSFACGTVHARMLENRPSRSCASF